MSTLEDIYLVNNIPIENKRELSLALMCGLDFIQDYPFLPHLSPSSIRNARKWLLNNLDPAVINPNQEFHNIVKPLIELVDNNQAHKVKEIVEQYFVNGYSTVDSRVIKLLVACAKNDNQPPKEVESIPLAIYPNVLKALERGISVDEFVHLTNNPSVFDTLVEIKCSNLDMTPYLAHPWSNDQLSELLNGDADLLVNRQVDEKFSAKQIKCLNKVVDDEEVFTALTTKNGDMPAYTEHHMALIVDAYSRQLEVGRLLDPTYSLTTLQELVANLERN